MTLCSFFISCFAFGVLLTAINVLLKRVDAIGIRFGIFSISVFGWGICTSLWMTLNYEYSTLLFLSRLSFVFGVFISITWVHFLFVFLGKPEPFKKFYSLNYGISFFLSIMAMTPWFVDKMEKFLEFSFYSHPGIFFHVFTAQFFLLVIYGFYHLIIKYLEAKGKKRQQLGYLFFGSILGFVAGSTSFFPCYKIGVPLYFYWMMPIYPVLMSIALTRYGLFEQESLAKAAQQDKLATIGILAASINHEVRNPLYVISGMAEGYLEREKDGLFKSDEEKQSKAKEVLESAIQQSRRAVEIIKRFALFAKEGVKEEMTLEQVPLAEVMEDVLPLVRHELELDRIELIREIPQDLPPLYADRHHLVQIFFNLIVNACQAMKTGGKLIIRGEKTKDGVRVSVEDNGPGMTQEYLAQIFEPFRTTKAEGTGLGLYITKLLVEKNSAHITVESEIGKGTKFILEFLKQ